MLNRFRCLTVCALCGFTMTVGHPAGAEGPRPNVILLMTDDQGWGDAGYQGHPELETPNLDAMAANGFVFNRWYAAAPVCSPTRASCLTGRHPNRLNIGGANDGRLADDEVTLAEVLRIHGYRTGHFGKWHLGTLTRVVKDSNRGGPHAEDIYAPPWDHGFEVCFSTEARTPTWNPMVSPGYASGVLRRGQEPGKSFQTYYWTGPGCIATDNLEGDDSRIIMDRVLPFIDDSVQDERPFFAVVWLHAPHEPIIAGPGDRAPYGALPEAKQHCYGVITALDEQVGRLRERLRALDVEDDTMLWYCSDNGPAKPHASGLSAVRAGSVKGKAAFTKAAYACRAFWNGPARWKPAKRRTCHARRRTTTRRFSPCSTWTCRKTTSLSTASALSHCSTGR